MWIREKVVKLKQIFRTDCPFEIAEQLKIHVLFHNLHEEIRGYYKYDRRNQYIVINENLNDQLKLLVCAHELGHASLHPRLNTPFMRQNTLFSVDKIEREANRFAAELLIPDENLFESYNQMTIYDIASIHQVPVELVKLKYKGLF
ncbi:ImmA/IrrE family metallo-endopeptidase [Lysinibacillus fusiformis]|uniref:ImmA/IrrE family metallo-endopeptidase n=1 Tax=Lysinibacillus fusiformis TaxID=28031 RepID=UPI00046868CD|nr:ImmA/IrrE family metallo-endopeptidase [Lysinibacillus fusiformis]